MLHRIAFSFAVTVALALFGASSASAQADCPDNRYSQNAMWLSIAHPGLGEWYLKGWGPFPEGAAEEVLARLHPVLRLAGLPAGEERDRLRELPHERRRLAPLRAAQSVWPKYSVWP